MDGKHVLEYIHAWYQDPLNAPNPCSIDARFGDFPSGLATQGLHLESDETFSLSAENVQGWTAFILSIYEQLKPILDPIYKLKKPEAPKPDQIVQLDRALFTLYWLITKGVFKALMTQNLVSAFKTRFQGKGEL